MFDTAHDLNVLIDSYYVFFVAIAFMQIVFLLGYMINRIKKG